jgi:outer membrane lipoprotein-sorting protein
MSKMKEKLGGRTAKLIRYRFLLTTVIVFCCLAGAVSAQEIMTANDYFNSISERYGRVDDYEARLTITREEEAVTGTVYYKNPNLLRINFSEPEEQVLALDGELLTIYIPAHSVIMQQSIKRHSSATLASMASSQGLNLLKRNYSIAYLSGPDPVPLDEESEEMVIKLKLEWKSTDEGFRQLEISVGENGLIRRIVGVTGGYENIQFDFTNIIINRNIPDARFQYESPASANVFNNFLFDPEG